MTNATHGWSLRSLLRPALVTLAIVGTVIASGVARQIEIGRAALERSRMALTLGDYRTAIEEAELAAASYVPRGAYHRKGFERLMLIADDALARADDDTAEMALTSAKSAARTSPGAATDAGADWNGAIAARSARLRSKTAELPKATASRTPIVVAETPPPLVTYAFLGIAGIAYLVGVGFTLRRGGPKHLSLAGLALGVGALFFGLALRSL